MKFNIFLKCIFLFLIIVAEVNYNATAQVLINEYSCANESTIQDNYTEYEDWIELYNAGAAPIDLTGYYLSDSKNNPTKWPIPSGILNPGAYRLFYASGRNIIVGTNSHTNFKLTQTANEEVVFSDPTGTILDSITIRPNLLNHSTGRTTNGAPTWSVFSTPTPNAANSGAFYGYAPKPIFSLNPGFYPGAQTLTLSVSDPSCTIRYTTDGTDPMPTSSAYTAPISIAQTTLIRARSYSSNANLLPGFIESNTFFINNNHTLPVVSLGGEFATLFASSSWAGVKLPSSFEYFDKNGIFQFEGYGESDKHGNDSWAYDQKGIDYVVKDVYGYENEFDYQIFHTRTRQKFQRLILKAAASDNFPAAGGPSCHIRDAFIQSLSERAGLELDGRASENCIVYINGQYWGVYELREKTMDPDYTEYYYGQNEEDLDWLSYWGGLSVDYGSDSDWNNLYNFITSNNMAVQANYNQAENRINVLSVIDYMILNTWSVNSDWISWNSMWWRGNGTPKVKWKYVNWDMDNTFDLGQNFSQWPNTTDCNAGPCDLEDVFVNQPPATGHFDIFNAFMDNPDFKSLFANRYAQLTQTYLSCNYAVAFFDSMIANIAPEMPAQIARWNPVDPGTLSEWQANVDYMRNQILCRCNVINQGIVDCYEVDGPYPIMVDVMPPLSGKVKWDNLTYQSYPNTTDYFGSVSANLSATPEPGYNFAYWEIKNASLGNDTLLSLINYPISTSDTIIAHFVPDIVHQLTIIAQPNIGGTVSINGSTPPSLPITNTYPDNAAVNLGALPSTGYYFKHYLVNNHLLLPNDSSINVSFNISSTDTVIAVFAEIPVYQITLGVLPLDAGILLANTTEVFPNPRTTNQNLNDPFDLSAVPNFGYKFIKYTTKHHTLFPDNETQDINFTVNNNDTIIAIFEPIQKVKLTVIVEPEKSGEVEFNFLDITNFPYQDSVYRNTTLSLEAKPYEQYSFSHWHMKNHFMVPDSLSEQVTCSILEMDTIIANFKLNEFEIPAVYIPLSFTPNGDGLNDFLSIRHSESIASASIKVFDRWGGLLFSNESIDFKWDGTKNGRNLPQAVYYYEVNYTKIDGESNIIRGTVVILY
jgi:gliding motility-associated-like protein